MEFGVTTTYYLQSLHFQPEIKYPKKQLNLTNNQENKSNQYNVTPREFTCCIWQTWVYSPPLMSQNHNWQNSCH